MQRLPIRVQVGHPVVGEPADVVAVGAHGVQLEGGTVSLDRSLAGVPVARERDPSAVGRPDGVRLECRRARQAAQPGPVGVDDRDVALGVTPAPRPDGLADAISKTSRLPSGDQSWLTMSRSAEKSSSGRWFVPSNFIR